MLDIQRLFSLLVHLPIVAWTSPRSPSDTVLNVIANHGVRDITFSQYVHVSLSISLCMANLDLPGYNHGTT